jgi:hypothetical protein
VEPSVIDLVQFLFKTERWQSIHQLVSEYLPEKFERGIKALKNSEAM